MDYGKNIRKIRIEANLTQKEMSERLLIYQYMISLYERNKRTPSFETAKKYVVFAETVGLKINLRHIRPLKRSRYEKKEQR